MNDPGPIVYLITPGRLTDENYATQAGDLLATLQLAIAEGVSHIQIREKALSGRRLFDLVCKAAELTRGTGTRLLVNDRADVAHLAGADGVHLTESSVTVEVIRKHFPSEFIVAVSTHSLAGAVEAKRAGADLVVFGAVFESPGKGVPAGLDELSNVCGALSPFPVVGLGGIDEGNCRSVLHAGASGIAAIRSLNDPASLRTILREIKTMRLDPPKAPPVCFTIAGLDPSGGAGVIADIKTFSAFGCFATAAVSSVTFQNTTGVFGAVHQTADSVRRQVEPVLDDYQVAAVKTGMLPTREIIEEVARLIESRKLRNIVVDPVVRSTSGFDLIDDAALAALIETLFPVADIITPNLPEAERITRMPIRSEDDINTAAQIMHSQGARNVLIKGGHHFDTATEARMARDYLFMGDHPIVLESEFIETRATHGTGCTLAAAIAANLALGKELVESVEISKRFVSEAIRTAPMLGKGNSPINI